LRPTPAVEKWRLARRLVAPGAAGHRVTRCAGSLDAGERSSHPRGESSEGHDHMKRSPRATCRGEKPRGFAWHSCDDAGFSSRASSGRSSLIRPRPSRRSSSIPLAKAILPVTRLQVDAPGMGRGSFAAAASMESERCFPGCSDPYSSSRYAGQKHVRVISA
jgi:hypothetical protein